MSRITFHIYRGDKKTPVLLRAPKKSAEDSGQKNSPYRSLVASESFGSIFCDEYQGAFGFFRLIRMSLHQEAAFFFCCKPGTLCLDFCLRGLFRHAPTRIKPGILVNTQLHLYHAGAKQKTGYWTGPTGSHHYSMLHISEAISQHETPQTLSDGIYYSDTNLTKWIQAIGGELATKHPRLHRLDRLMIFALLASADLNGPAQMAQNSNSVRDQEAHRISILAENIILGMDEYWSIPKLAGSAKYSEAKLKALFKKNIGMSSTAFKISVRLEKAKRSLVHSQLPVREIAAAVGYLNPAHFSRLFKNKIGCSPTAFRKKAIKKNSPWHPPG